MAKRVELHGGPHHGEILEVPDGHSHLHIVGMPKVGQGVREGTYSQVSGAGNAHNYEWDGWISHE